MEAPGSIFEAPRLDLGGFWNDFFDIFGQNTKKAKKRLKPAKQELNHKWPDCQGWVGGGAPPRGVSIKSAAPPGTSVLNRDVKFFFYLLASKVFA